jgi:hypothetical protein
MFQMWERHWGEDERGVALVALLLLSWIGVSNLFFTT